MLLILPSIKVTLLGVRAPGMRFFTSRDLIMRLREIYTLLSVGEVMNLRRRVYTLVWLGRREFIYTISYMTYRWRTCEYKTGNLCMNVQVIILKLILKVGLSNY